MSGTGSAPSSGRMWGAGTVFLAGVLLLLSGIWQAIVGLVALTNDTFFFVGEKWIFQFDLTSWGWIHLLVGVFLFLAGVFVLRGALWASITGIVLAGLSAVVNFMWLPWTPLWSILLIALDVLIIWALATHRRDVQLIDS